MVASENGALPGGKAGGVGDVLRDLPRALAARGHRVTVITPAYGKLHLLPDMRPAGDITAPFAGMQLPVDVYSQQDGAGVRHVVFVHDQFDPDQSGSIYHDDGADRPFATDATKFALLSSAAAIWLLQHAADDAIIHLNDWHAAMVLVLRALDPTFAALSEYRMVLTLHNLALQGIRPKRGDPSSFERWFPHLDDSHGLLDDPRYDDCINPMAAGIRLADAVNTVSPTNAREILQPNDPARGFRGGEGLERILQQADNEGRLNGILNGCEYSVDKSRLSWKRLREYTLHLLEAWQDNQPHYAGVHTLALESLARYTDEPDIILTSVGRLTEQKLGLLLHRDHAGVSTLTRLLSTLPDRGVLFMLGSGGTGMEQDLVEHARQDARLIFVRGFSDTLADACYRAGQLFLMPSAFEPCGISQMLAMRAAQPCLVHAVGGLNDTVEHLVSGFSFSGDSVEAQATNCVAALRLAQRVFFDEPDRWHLIAETAAARRFEWADAAAQYERALYDLT